MCRIDDLIAQYCPNGVEYKELQEIFITRNGYTPSTTNKAFWSNGTIPWFRMEDIRTNGNVLSQSVQLITKEAVKGDKLFPANSILVATSATIGEHALITVPHLSNQRFTSLSLKPNFKKQLDVRFAYYYCFVLDRWCLNNTTRSSFASVDMAGFKKFMFPLPPLPVQQAIVDILDKFTQLEAELEAELEARQKQYAYYRDNLLSFENNSSSCVQWRTLGEVGVFIRGNGLQKKDFTDTGVGCIHYGQIYTHYGTYADKTKTYVSPELAATLKKVETGDVVIAVTSENLEDVCKCVAWLGNETIVTGGHAMIYKHNENPKYIAYYLQTVAFFNEKRRYARGAKVIDISKKDIEKIKIPVPPLEEQERIVAILDKFDTLVNDISSGLPAEISARRQQYEYYRNKLLTFQELRND